MYDEKPELNAEEDAQIVPETSPFTIADAQNRDSKASLHSLPNFEEMRSHSNSFNFVPVNVDSSNSNNLQQCKLESRFDFKLININSPILDNDAQPYQSRMPQNMDYYTVQSNMYATGEADNQQYSVHMAQQNNHFENHLLIQKYENVLRSLNKEFMGALEHNKALQQQIGMLEMTKMKDMRMIEELKQQLEYNSGDQGRTSLHLCILDLSICKYIIIFI